MGSYQKVKGTRDFIGLKAEELGIVKDAARKTARRYGYKEIITPIIENSKVFKKNVGEDSDIVNKEMYLFKDKGDRELALRPEGTAGVVRAYLENKLYATGLPLEKLFYFGPMFRYEQPQTGRYREFRQFGLEVFGKSSSFLLLDVILSAFGLFKELNVTNIVLKINSIGDFKARSQYADALRTYFSRYIALMCPDCQERIKTNPLRILDCKKDKDLIADGIKIMDHAPLIKDYLPDEAKKELHDVCSLLESFAIPYEVDPTLVRGLDYYTDIVFEFIIKSDDELNNLAVGGGGCYANLVKQMGNIDIPGLGYALGIDRLLANMENLGLFRNLKDDIDVVIISLDDLSKKEALKMAEVMRKDDLRAEMDYLNNNLKPQFKLCDKLNPRYIVIIGEDEIKSGEYTLKDVLHKTQNKYSLKELILKIKENRK